MICDQINSDLQSRSDLENDLRSNSLEFGKINVYYPICIFFTRWWWPNPCRNYVVCSHFAKKLVFWLHLFSFWSSFLATKKMTKWRNFLKGVYIHQQISRGKCKKNWMDRKVLTLMNVPKRDFNFRRMKIFELIFF